MSIVCGKFSEWLGFSLVSRYPVVIIVIAISALVFSKLFFCLIYDYEVIIKLGICESILYVDHLLKLCTKVQL